MTLQQPLKQILAATREHWDRPETREIVRQNLTKVLNCRTPALGAEVFASDTEEKLVYHTCKSKACLSCGYRATLLWQRQQWADLPNIPYEEVTFTMPNVLWPIFQQNPDLLHGLPALGAAVIQQWVRNRYGVRVLLMVVQHTFGRHLNFNLHLHILVSAGGLRESDGRWVAALSFNKPALMHMWRYAVITYLRSALDMRVLTSDLDADHLRRVFKTQYERWWDTHVAHFKSKQHFLRYAGRYVRRPPIAQRRFMKITDREVQFWTKDLRLKQRVIDRHSIEEFVDLLAQHIPERYKHAVRYFGLLAPGSKSRTNAALFVLLGQKRLARPPRLRWAESLRRDFGVNPLLDSQGRLMHWVGRQKPVAN